MIWCSPVRRLIYNQLRAYQDQVADLMGINQFSLSVSLITKHARKTVATHSALREIVFKAMVFPINEEFFATTRIFVFKSILC